MVRDAPTIRPRREADLAACLPGLARAHRQDGYPYRWPDDPAGWVRGRDVIGGWVAVDGAADAVVGHVVLRRAAGHADAATWGAATGRPADGHGLVARLWVDPDARGRGHARALLDVAVADAASRRLWPVLDVMAHNRAAVELYERLGWRRVGQRDFAFPDGVSLPMYCYVGPSPDA